MKVGSVFGKMAGKEGTALLLICVLSGVCISTSQSLSVSSKRHAIFESMQYMYNRETLLSLRQVRANCYAGALDLYDEFPDLQPTRKRGQRGASRLKIGRPALRTAFPDDQVDVSFNSSPFPPRGEQLRRSLRLRCLTVIRPDADLSPCFSATSGLLVGHNNAR